ncbi:hypothetical protein Bequi_02335 [Brachybacterium sp. JHP9]|uniref:DUF4352 domain-containing protein n=1 Tax=Brachybacterium equifaecis TaxID=2910770 RepID=A0ABT0QYF4_9MICO|nr:hypothetical protein [Brachybacterium equifaecis]MCL6422238.1 hypothetical protein [Brachybacterium equifaecis]
MSAPQTPPRSRALSAVAAGLALAALGLGSWVNSAVPSVRDSVADPFVRTGAIGQSVALRTARVEVLGVDGASVVVTPSGAASHSDSGVWVVVTVRIEGDREPVSLSGVSIESADGRVYAQSRSDVPAACGEAQPHVPWVCPIAVEMPVEAIPGAHVVIPVNGSVRGDAVAEVDLGIDAATAQSWRERSMPLEVPASAPEEAPL